MDDKRKLVELGKEMGLSGEALLECVSTEEKEMRDQRAKDREEARLAAQVEHEREMVRMEAERLLLEERRRVAEAQRPSTSSADDSRAPACSFGVESAGLFKVQGRGLLNGSCLGAVAGSRFVGEAYRAWSSLLEKAVVAVLGPRKPEAASLVGSACAGQRVPHIFLSQEFQPNVGVNAASVSVSVAPPHYELDKALQDLVKAQRWKSFTIIYEKPDALVRLRGLLHLTQPGSLPIPVSLRLLPEKMNPGIVLREIAKNGENNIVLDVATHKLDTALVWFENHEESLTTWDHSAIQLTECFGDSTGKRKRAEQTLLQCAQVPGETCTTYSETILKLCKTANPHMSEEDKVGHFLEGIAEDVYTYLIGKESLNSVAEVIHHCRTFETLKLHRITPKFGRLANVVTVASIEDSCSIHWDLATSVRQIVREELKRHSKSMNAAKAEQLGCVFNQPHEAARVVSLLSATPGVADSRTIPLQQHHHTFPHDVTHGQRAYRDAALTQDALIVLVRAIQSLAKARALEAPPRFSCRTSFAERNLTQSNMLKEAVSKIRFSGLSGPFWLDSSGQRRNVSLYVAKLKRTGLTSVGTWSASSGLNITRAEKMFEDEILSVLKNKTLRITTILNAPYVMLKKSTHKLEGNDRFEGYCVDLLREISATLGFRYRLKLVRDGAYGARDSQGRWNGLMRELVDMEADLAIGDLTITSEREQSVDFTMPFMTSGVSILYKKTDHKRSLLFFLSPLSGDVWLCVAGACVAVSVILCCVARAQSTVWRNKTLPTVQSDFTLPNSCWFIVSAITRQGCGIFPRAASARIIAATWWIFSFVLVSSYTANLAAFLTKERLLSPIESAEDLAKQSAVRYGCVRSGSTHALFKEWRHETYEMMWHAMKEDLVSSIAEGIERVERGGYAFLIESTSIEYVVRRRCQLKQIAGLLDSKGYGIATPHGSPYQNILSSTLLRLQEHGTLQKLKDRWWNVRDPLKRCPTTEAGESRTDAASELGLRTVGGVFVVLLAGLGLACLIAFAELFCKARIGRS
ncbi:hypothetical protein HPB51_028990 [Rhipicephalus microplus]|uniref:Uncharacterized protein n=1 Tax=Rhipicephalus microplus TaxID=6941 RepID=A0A9J6CVT8_RHIMP|nr:hypothetical protein HPB51_028990 [Rhipicephalus microplus]